MQTTSLPINACHVTTMLFKLSEQWPPEGLLQFFQLCRQGEL